MPPSDPGEVTLLLARARSNDAQAAEELFQRLYGELRALAGAAMQRDRAGHTLQPTALVHEAWIKLAAPGGLNVNDREHFLALAARAMRQVLVDHARGKHAEKRSSGREALSLHDEAATVGMTEVDVLALEEALARLAAYSTLKARIVELRFFGGLSIDEVARVTGISSSSVDREWSFARAWLADALSGDGENDG